MMKKLLLLLLALILIGTVSFTVFKNRKTEIVSSSHNDHTVVIYMVGEPDFPFGSTHCEAVLKKGKRTVRKESIELKNDGKIADETNFDIIWNTDSVTVIAKGEEMDDMEYTFTLE